MTNSSKTLGLIGLAMRAGQLTLGSDATREALNKRRVYLLVLAEDAALATVKKLEEKAKETATPTVHLAKKAELGNILGRETVAVLGITNKPFAKGLIQLIRSD